MTESPAWYDMRAPKEAARQDDNYEDEDRGTVRVGFFRDDTPYDASGWSDMDPDRVLWYDA